jgi:MFS family permease
MQSTGVHTLPAARGGVYYGWVVLGVAALAMVGTLPGRTQGLGLITEPLLRDLGLGRVAYAQINLVATLLGALGCFGVGRLLDRYGSRSVLTVLALLLGVVVVAMSQAVGFAALLVFVTLTRAVGQSALSVVSLAMVGKWFRQRLTKAMAIYALVMSVGFMLAFPAVGAVVQSQGWRFAWGAIGVSLLLGLAPVAWLFDRSSPETVGLEVDGGHGGGDEARMEPAAWTLGEALRSPAFWVFALSSAAYGLVASGIGLFNESILAERGFAPDVYYNALAVTAITGLAGNFAAGALADRGSLRHVLLVSLLVLTGALAALAHVTTVAQVMAQAVAMGVAGGFVMVVFFSFWGRAYGRAHLGRIQGAAQALTVLASAVGPLFLASFVETTGSYAAGFYTLAAAVASLAVATLVVPIPPGAQSLRSAINA